VEVGYGQNVCVDSAVYPWGGATLGARPRDEASPRCGVGSASLHASAGQLIPYILGRGPRAGRVSHGTSLVDV
jgi:hypothetical protein